MFAKYVFIALIVVTIVLSCFLYASRSHNDSLNAKIETLQTKIDVLQTKLDESEKMCQSALAQSKKAEQSMTQFSYAAGKEIVESHKKMNEVTHDETACDWLDAALPDSIQLLYNTDSARRGEVCTEPAADDTFGAMPATVSNPDENKP